MVAFVTQQRLTKLASAALPITVWLISVSHFNFHRSVWLKLYRPSDCRYGPFYCYGLDCWPDQIQDAVPEDRESMIFFGTIYLT